MYLESGRIRLRALEKVDADLLYRWENDEKYWQLSNTVQPFSYEVLSDYVMNDTHDIYQSKQLRLMIEIKNQGKQQTIGTIDLFEFDPYHLRAGIGILIYSEKDRRQAYAQESLTMLLSYALDKLGLKQLFCHISESNTPSIHLFQKMGFQKIGVKKQWNRISATEWEDVGIYQKIL